MTIEVNKVPRFLMVHLAHPREEKEVTIKNVEELYALIQALGKVEIIDVIKQRDLPSKHTFIGSGKAYEIGEKIKEERIDIVVMNSQVKTGQLANLKKIWERHNPKIEVWDRIDLILQIFSRHAHTAEAKLQIQLAQMRHMGPRIYGMGFVLSQQGGGIGTRGIGETNTELMKRHWRDAIKEVTEKLNKLTKDREQQLEKRKKQGLQTVSIVGYTNAGKTSLFNMLTGKDNTVQNALFVTLDSAVGKLYLPNLQQEVLITDTIGFIRNLPTDLINAFKSTLMESVEADLLLQVIDISDPDLEKKIRVVEGILRDLGVTNKKRVYIFNKIDKLSMNAEVQTVSAEMISEDIIENTKKKYQQYQPQYISIKNRNGIEGIVEIIEHELKK